MPANDLIVTEFRYPVVPGKVPGWPQKHSMKSRTSRFAHLLLLPLLLTPTSSAATVAVLRP